MGFGKGAGNAGIFLCFDENDMGLTHDNYPELTATNAPPCITAPSVCRQHTRPAAGRQWIPDLAVRLFLLLACLAGCNKAAAPPAAPAPAATYVANVSSRIVHRGDCRHVAEMKPANRVDFDDLPDALAEGFRPCKRCMPAATAPTTTPGEDKP